MIIDKFVELRGHGSNRKLLESLGYEFNNRKTYLVKVEDLMDKSAAKIKMQCDYCESFFVKQYWSILKGRETIQKDCCGKPECMKQKRKEVTQSKYGVSNINKLQAVKDKIKKTNIEKYGVENVFQHEEFIIKHKNTIKEKYGISNISQIEEVKAKKKDTMMTNYGVSNPMQSPLLQEKARKTLLLKTGYEHAINIPKNREKIKFSLSKKILNPNEVRASYTQTYLWKLFGGELNYQLKMYSLDIALITDRIYIEYDGSGHNLSVQLGRISEKDFLRKEIIRNEVTKNEGWKCIRIVATKDKIPSDEKLHSMFKFAKEYFIKGHSWIAFDIEREMVYGSKISESYEFGELFSKYKIKNKLIEYGIVNNAI